jgi:transcriptional regulator with XRE-family HTH domain
VEWERIRAAYVAAFEAKGWTKAKVARLGGLENANAITKLMRNRNRGPEVETFVRAVAGLGLSVAQFFAALESSTSGGARNGASSATVARPPISPREFDDIVRQTFTFLTQLIAQRGIGGVVSGYRDPPLPSRPPAPKPRRSHRRRTRKAA